MDPFLFMARNSVVLQEGPCFTPRFEVFPNQPNDEWLWPTDAFIEGGLLRVVVQHMRPTNGRPGFNFEFMRMEVATFSLKDLQFQSLSQFPIMAAAPNPTYGENILIDSASGYLYAYGRKRVNTFQDHHYVARVQIDDFWQSSMWQFWDDDDPLMPPDGAWVNMADAADPMAFTDGVAPPDVEAGPLAGFSPEPVTGGFLGTAMDADVVGDKVETWDNTNPAGEHAGPWMYRAMAADVSFSLDHQSSYSYGGRVLFVPGVLPMALWSVNADFDAVLDDPNLYRAYFAAPAMGSVP